MSPSGALVSMSNQDLGANETTHDMKSGEYRSQFYIPQVNGKDSIYLCGNSLGLQPRKVKEYVNAELEDWASLGVEGHLHARHPWLPYHEFLTQSMARLVGGKENEVVVMNSLTVNLHLLMASFYRPDKKRYKILIESDAFPSDRYAVASQAAWHGYDPLEAVIAWKPEPGEFTLRTESLKEILDQQGDEIALILLGGVNYYTGQYFNIPEITALGHDYGIMMGWDLAHAAGNVDLDLHKWNVDFAAWCGYKYLNSGPGGLSGIFIHEKHGSDLSTPRLSGWWGHNKQTRFKMRNEFDPLPGAEGWQLSNPPILPLAALRASLEIFDEAGIKNLRKISKTNAQIIFAALDGNTDLTILTPNDPDQRGCQVSLLATKNGEVIFNRLSKAGVIADWREPNVIRIAPTPTYNTQEDIDQFLKILTESL